MDFLVIEAEALPDLAGARLTYGLAGDLQDDAVSRVLFHRHNQRRHQQPCLAPHLRAVAAVAVIHCRDDAIAIWRTSAAESGEAEMLGELQRRVGRGPQTPLFWDGGRVLDAWLRLRCLINEVAVAPAEPAAVDGMLGCAALGLERSELADRLQIPCQSLPSDEDVWRAFRSAGIGPVQERCVLNALATAQLFLRHQWVCGRINSDELEDSMQQLARLSAGAVSPS